MEAIANFLTSTGFYQFFQGENWKSAIMLVIACVLLFLGIVKKFEPLLLVPIAIGMLVTNLPGAGMFHEILFAGGHVHWELFGGQPITASFLSEMLNSGVSADVLQPYVDSLWTAAQSMFGADALSQVAAQVAAATGCEFHRRTDPDPGQRRAVRCRQRSDHEQCHRFRGPGGCAVSGY